MVSQSIPNQYLADPDVQLMLRVASDDAQSFAELVTRYQDRLIGFFYQLLRDRSVAEDLAQETFLRVYRSRQNYQPTARFSTWIFRIAHNLCSNSRRSRNRRREVPLAETEFDTGENPVHNKNLAEKSALMPSRVIDSLEIQNVVRHALESLNERQKTAVILHKFQHMSYEDIGEIMGLSVVGVKSLLSRARVHLKDLLRNYASEMPR